ncbi:hypothetical protein ElyMa_000493300 [Elysia marginata]|uniref:Uncharacterized protein n=1 Tax=Elysia marginata TaxID=1093978 RepID=A0AAV4FX08_9GAST|nr:hypothetical protein ElyMa_000493300 [Elysia marginata]
MPHQSRYSRTGKASLEGRCRNLKQSKLFSTFAGIGYTHGRPEGKRRYSQYQPQSPNCIPPSRSYPTACSLRGSRRSARPPTAAEVMLLLLSGKHFLWDIVWRYGLPNFSILP